MTRPGNTRELDDIDRQILKILQKDGRTALSEIARRLDMGTATIHERADALERDGFIREYRAVLDPELLGLDEVAFVKVYAEAGRFSEVGERLAETPRVHEIHEVTGSADLLLKVRVSERADLTALLADVGEQEGVEGTETSVVLRTIKEENTLDVDDG